VSTPFGRSIKVSWPAASYEKVVTPPPTQS
jgi:putative transposon-encoded protein